jgi:hypothetical protein
MTTLQEFLLFLLDLGRDLMDRAIRFGTTTKLCQAAIAVD